MLKPALKNEPPYGEKYLYSSASNPRRIAKNTLMLYFRQLLIMLVSLYTVRAVLETLGAEDYGIYNVTAGVVTMLGFLSNSMATASQRYFAFEIGRGDFEQLKKTFSLSFFIYAMIAAAVLLLAETIGLWFVNNKLAIPSERTGAVRWIYQFSIISFVFTILTTPYMAAIIAHEDMNIYASVSIMEAVLKLIVVFLLKLIPLDKLQLYGILLCAVTVLNSGIYRTICGRKYEECKFRFYWSGDLFREIAGFTGWNLFGACVGIFKNQAVNILLNQFFNPLVIAARGIASTVNAAVVSFSQNFSTALRPQIIKSYAAKNKTEMLKIMAYGCKGTYLLMYLFAFPLILEMPLVLLIWLKNIPGNAILFTRLALIDALIDSVSFPLMAAAQATGKIKLYQSVVGGILLLNLPVSWLILLLGASAPAVMVTAIFLTLSAFIARFLILKHLVNYPLRHFLKEVIIPVGLISALSAIIPFAIHRIFDYGIIRLLTVTGAGFVSVCVFAFIFGLSGTDRIKVKSIIRHLFYT
jgi:O-antigen/teichoic acid export membrane protein